MGDHSEAFIGIDTSKTRNAVAIAQDGRGGEVRYLGEFAATDAATRKLVAKLAAKYSRLIFCYEAGPTGYGLYRIAWNAQTRLCGRFRSLVRKGKRPTIVATAIARELSAFIWAINRAIMGNRQA